MIHFLLTHEIQILTNAQALEQTSVIQTLFVPTLKERMLVAVKGDTQEVVGIAQVRCY